MIYLVVITLLLFAAIINNRSTSFFYLLSISAAIFLCFGYMTGSDWRSYELLYNKLLDGYNYEKTGTDIGYFIYMKMFVFFGISFWPFFIFTKIILFASNVFFLKKFLPQNYSFTIFVFVCWIGLFLFIDNPMRNLIASTIYLFSVESLINKNFKKYILITGIAFLFHKSIIFTIPLYFILNKKYDKKKIVVSFVLFNVLIEIYSAQLISFFQVIDLFSFSSSQKLNEQIIRYFFAEDVRDKFTFGLLSRYIIFIILVISKERIESFSKYGTIIFNSSIISIFLLRLVLIWPIILRLTLPLSVLYCVSISILVVVYRKDLKYVYKLLFVVIFIGSSYTQITSTYKYVPYTNYLSYLFQDKPSYNYRSNYNFRESPYN